MIGTLDGLRKHHTDRLNTGPQLATDQAATAALIRASDYLEAHYLPKIRDKVAAKAVIEKSAYIIAGYEINEPGAFSKVYSRDSMTVMTKLDGMEWEYIGDAKAPESAVAKSTEVEALLRPYISVSGVFRGFVA